MKKTSRRKATESRIQNSRKRQQEGQNRRKKKLKNNKNEK